MNSNEPLRPNNSEASPKEIPPITPEDLIISPKTSMPEEESPEAMPEMVIEESPSIQEASESHQEEKEKGPKKIQSSISEATITTDINIIEQADRLQEEINSVADL